MTSRLDRTEVDLKIGDLLVEAKLTESDFQHARKTSILRYRDFREVFDEDLLPCTGEYFNGYQLIRNVLAAYASRCSLCVLLDARRPDLVDAWYTVMRSVKPVTLRTACKVLTWQELSLVLPASMQSFLAVKYGIH
jgi:predicted restriction endonuclease